MWDIWLFKVEVKGWETDGSAVMEAFVDHAFKAIWAAEFFLGHFYQPIRNHLLDVARGYFLLLAIKKINRLEAERLSKKGDIPCRFLAETIIAPGDKNIWFDWPKVGIDELFWGQREERGDK